MSDLIRIETLVDGTVVVDSRIVAEELGIDHRSFIDTLGTYRNVIESEFGVLRFETAKPLPASVGGRPIRWAWLTEDQAAVAATFSRNTDQVIRFKVKLVKAFKVLNDYAQGDRLFHLEKRLEALESKAFVPGPQPSLPDKRQLAQMFDAIAIDAADGSITPIKEIWAELERYYLANGVLTVKNGDRAWIPGVWCIKGANQVYEGIKQVFRNATRVSLGSNRKGIQGIGFRF